jgi:hypothetical protein
VLTFRLLGRSHRQSEILREQAALQPRSLGRPQQQRKFGRYFLSKSERYAS